MGLAFWKSERTKTLEELRKLDGELQLLNERAGHRFPKGLEGAAKDVERAEILTQQATVEANRKLVLERLNAMNVGANADAGKFSSYVTAGVAMVGLVGGIFLGDFTDPTESNSKSIIVGRRAEQYFEKLDEWVPLEGSECPESAITPCKFSLTIEINRDYKEIPVSPECYRITALGLDWDDIQSKCREFG